MSNSHWFKHARWFEKARFGMFITWSPIAAVGERNGWFIDHECIPPEEYEKWAESFNPKINVRDWVILAKEAGMKYICLVTKDHNGFCLFDTKVTPFNTMNTPAHRDFVAELAQACKEEGIVLCLYYSLLDWHQPDYRTDLKKYIKFYQEQLRELATKYGNIGVFWFDGGWDHTAQEWQAEEAIQLLRKLQPNALINDRIGLPGNFDTPEQHGVAFPVHPGTGDRFFESCMTINTSWSYAPYDLAHKSVTTLIRLLVDNAGKGGNFLLNVAPDVKGQIQSEHVERLREIGAWLKGHGESIYGTQGSPWRALPFGRCTVQNNRIYLHIFDWPNQPLSLSGLTNRVKSAYLLPKKESVSFEQDRLWLTLDLPTDAPNPHDSVVLLEIEGEPQVDETIQLDLQRGITLPASLATVSGGIRFQQGISGPGYLTNWKSMRDSIGWGWDLNREAEGDYQVQITYSNGQQLGGGKYSVTVNGQRLVRTAMPTGGWDHYAITILGVIKLKSGHNRLVLRGELLPYESVMRLVRIVLKPTDA